MELQRSSHLTALTQEIERKLHRALNSPSQRAELLRQLFADVALEIDDRARELILSRDENGAASPDDEIESVPCFYEVLANHYVKFPENGKNTLDLIVQLWSLSFASHIFALLFHKWLFEVSLESSERYGSALVQGASNVFWIDIQTNTRRFLSLFCYLLGEVALNPTRLDKISVQAQRDMFLLLSRFMLFYDRGWAISTTHDKPFLSATLSLVLALVLLEFHCDVHKSSFIFHSEVTFFKLGKYEEKQKRINEVTLAGLHN